ncbi:mannitol dehydrogenase domain-containing protein [Trametes coccinea BRFM310]|uniref:Mannitol-1-phosphate 5-dehydrogenase n=1 Tax=Trametes coccinea (strain BRFM310) TaxID=1353009 RepID=A0A1Y2J2A5_TRAC3|nr:mannitol dehydrogenase domain-containing protein [Trametes coccinea BRFM310]
MSQPERKAIHFGAGNIGRGFIGPLLVDSGYHVVFADVNKDIIQKLNEQNSYEVLILDEESEQRASVSDVSGVVSTSDDIVQVFADPAVDLVTTAVGPQILEKIAVTIAQGLHARREADAGPLNIIACENMINQTTTLRNHVYEHLADDDKEWVEENIGFANCSVDRIVPPFDPKDSATPLDVGVEGFYEWVVDEKALRRTRPDVKLKGVKLTTSLDAYIERKLFTLNCGHAITAYLGFLKGYNTIDEAIRDEDIRETVRKALLNEGGAALWKKHNFDEDEYRQYVEKTMERFANPRLKDEIVRVGRQPLRKLAKGDRLLGPAYMAREYSLPIDNLAKGIAAAFLYEMPDDKQSVELQKKVEKDGIEHAVAEITGFDKGSKEHRKVVDAYHALSKIDVRRSQC